MGKRLLVYRLLQSRRERRSMNIQVRGRTELYFNLGKLTKIFQVQVYAIARG